MEGREEHSLPRFHDGFLWIAYYKFLVWKDYISGGHYQRVEKRRGRTINRQESEIKQYQARKKELIQKEKQVKESERTFSEAYAGILGLQLAAQEYRQRAEGLIVENVAMGAEIADLTRAEERHTKLIALQRRALRGLETGHLNVLISEINRNVGKGLVAVIDREDRIKYASPRLLKVTGFSSEEVLGKNYLEFLNEPEEVFETERQREKRDFPYLHLTIKNKSPLLVRVLRSPYKVSVPLRAGGDREVRWYLGAKVEFNKLGLFERGRIKKRLEETRNAERKKLKEGARKLAADTRNMAINDYGVDPEELDSDTSTKAVDKKE